MNILNLKIKLSNKKLSLIPVSLKYLKDFNEYSKNRIFFKYFEYDHFKTNSESKIYLNKIIKLSKKKNFQYWFIVLKNNKCIGTISIKNLDHRKSAELGYGINPNFWRKGYFSLSFKILENFLVKKNNLKRLYATTFSNNLPSIKSLIKLGFKVEGNLKSFYKKKQKYYDATLLAKIY